MPDPTVLAALPIFLYGACVGSFLGVCIDRIPYQLPIARSHSSCRQCGHRLGPLEMVPLLSYATLKARCLCCKAPIPWQLPFIEALAGAIFTVCYMRFGISLKTASLCLFASALIVAAGIDVHHTYVPDGIPLFITILAAARQLLPGGPPMFSCIAGSLGLGGMMLLISLATKGGIGGGDIKLVAAAGLFLGFYHTVLSFFAAYILAALYCVPFLIHKKFSWGYALPMAPFFACSMMGTALWGKPLIIWYLSFYQ